jgi:hypothetical protein
VTGPAIRVRELLLRYQIAAVGRELPEPTQDLGIQERKYPAETRTVAASSGAMAKTIGGSEVQLISISMCEPGARFSTLIEAGRRPLSSSM